MWLLQDNRNIRPAGISSRLIAKMRLEIGHQQSGGNAFPHDVADYQSKLVPTELEKVVKIPADLASLKAYRSVFQGRKCRPLLREKPGLYLASEFEFLARAALGFEPLHMSPALLLHFAGDFVATEKRK